MYTVTVEPQLAPGEFGFQIVWIICAGQLGAAASGLVKEPDVDNSVGAASCDYSDWSHQAVVIECSALLVVIK